MNVVFLTPKLIGPLLAALLAAALAGCGGEEIEPAEPDASPAPSIDLLVKLDPGSADELAADEARLVCFPESDPATVRSPACIAAGWLTAGDFEPAPEGTVCAPGDGPDVVEIEGLLRGEPVEGTFTLADSCEARRFARILPLVESLFKGYRRGEVVIP